jgi:hypothetical protein
MVVYTNLNFHLTLSVQFLRLKHNLQIFKTALGVGI